MSEHSQRLSAEFHERIVKDKKLRAAKRQFAERERQAAIDNVIRMRPDKLSKT